MPSRTTLRSFIYALILHAVAGALLVISIDLTPEVIHRPLATANIVETVTVDSAAVEAELERLRDADRKKAEEEQRRETEQQRRLEEIRRKAAEAEKQRLAEEKRLAEVARQKEQEQKQREAEEKRLADLKKQQEELERRRKLEEEQRRKEEEEQKRREEEARQKAEEERRRKEAEEALKKQLAEEQRALDEAKAKQEQGIINQYVARIASAIEQEFNRAGLPPGLSCVLQVRMIPGGEVVEARIAKSSGNPIFDRRAEIAVTKASPLPVPDEPRLFDKMREINFIFTPR